tara:strand:+ start:321 stop:1013 length:693 start_codon:yes stop_codon:yes gene_type:complete
MVRTYIPKKKPIGTQPKLIKDIMRILVITLRDKLDDELVNTIQDMFPERSGYRLHVDNFVETVLQPCPFYKNTVNISIWNPTIGVAYLSYNDYFKNHIVVFDSTANYMSLSKKCKNLIEKIIYSSNGEFHKSIRKALKKYQKEGEWLITRFNNKHESITKSFIPIQTTRDVDFFESMKCFFICCRRVLRRDIARVIISFMIPFRRTWPTPNKYVKPFLLIAKHDTKFKDR